MPSYQLVYLSATIFKRSSISFQKRTNMTKKNLSTNFYDSFISWDDFANLVSKRNTTKHNKKPTPIVHKIFLDPITCYTRELFELTYFDKFVFVSSHGKYFYCPETWPITLQVSDSFIQSLHKKLQQLLIFSYTLFFLFY